MASGICMINTDWSEQHSHLIPPLSHFLNAAAYRLNFLRIQPDFIFNTAGLSVAFIFITDWKADDLPATFNRIEKTKSLFGNFYVIVAIASKEDNQAFINSYFKSGISVGKPTFIPVRDPRMGFEKMLKLALVHGEIKRQDVVTKIQTEQKRSVESVEACISVLTAIPGIDTHDALTGIGSLQAISKASNKMILNKTDLCADKAQKVTQFFNDSDYCRRPKLN